MALSQADFERLLELRSGLRRFLHWGEQQAEAAGITPAQHELLLAIKGHPDPAGPTVADVAGYLAVRHHSAVGLIDRAVTAGLVHRIRDARNRAKVRLGLTRAGRAKLEALVDTHRDELAHLVPTMRALATALERPGGEQHPAALPITSA